VNGLRVFALGLACAGLLAALAEPAPGRRATAAPGAVTYSKEIAPILYKNCVSCHRAGEVAPFPLESYQDAAKRARLLAEAAATRYMPPWKPEPGYGEFRGERRLTEREIALLQRWADTGAPRGDAADLPPAPTFADGWQMGEPDLVLKMPQPFTVSADGPDVFQTFVIPMNLPRDEYVAGYEFRPDNRRVLHHSVSYLDNSGTARRKDAADPAVGYSSFGGPGFTPSGALGGWSPGASAVRLPEGVAQPVRRGTDLVIQNHYHPTGKVETDQSSVALYFSKTPPKMIAVSVPLFQRGLDIPPGAKRHRVSASLTTPIDIQVISVTPHMHFLGREMKVTATLGTGAAVPLIWIKDWDYYWHSQYQYRTPLALPAGTRIEMEAFFDNSADNPRNPNDPPERVGWGSETTDEMALCFIQVAVEKSSEAAELRSAVLKQLGFAR